jgi:hypothetical protein
MISGIITNFVFLSIIRSISNTNWAHNHQDSSPSTFQQILLYISLIITVVNIIAVRSRARGFKIFPSTLISTACSILQCTLLFYISLDYIIKHPPSYYHYINGGAAACVSAAVSSLIAFMGFLLDLLYFNQISRHETFAQKKFEYANLYYISYVIISAFIFSIIEGWSYEQSAEFCMVTLLTIGYGNIVPVTLFGRLFMILFSCVGLCVAGFYLFTFQQVLGEESDTEFHQISRSTLDCDSSLNDISIESNEELKQISKWNSLVKQSVFVLLWVLLWWLGSAYVFSITESNWDFFNAAYVIMD